jgi:hypothetical protein
MSKPTFTVRIEQVHECGQIFEQVAHMTADDLFSLMLSSDPGTPFDPARAFTIPERTPPKLTLVGHYDKVDINGVDMRDHQMLCKHCGGDVLFGLRPDPA